MTIYYAKNSSGDFWFYDSEIGSVPTPSIEITNSDYSKFLLAQQLGAKIVVSSTGTPQAISKNGMGDIIDLATVTSSSNYRAIVPLNKQASAALASARTYVYNNYGILNEDTPSDWVTYIKALMAIVNGTDTTSTELPTQPTD